MGIAAAVAATAVAVGSVGSALISSHAANKATDAARQAQEENNALAKQQFGVVEGNAQPWIDRGNAAGGQINDLLGLGKNPAAAQKAFDTFRNSDGYQFRLNQGVGAITGNAATSGLLNSGSTLKALDNYGQGAASQEFGNYMNDLYGVSNQGLDANKTLAGASAANVAAQSSNNNNYASAVGTAAYQNANNINSVLQNSLGSLSSIYGARGASSFGGGANGLFGGGGGGYVPAASDYSAAGLY